MKINLCGIEVDERQQRVLLAKLDPSQCVDPEVATIVRQIRAELVRKRKRRKVKP